jgi:hypothetical protein
VSEKDEVQPSHEYLENVVVNLITPKLADIGNEVGRAISAVVTVYVKGIAGPTILSGVPSQRPCGHIDLRFRKTAISGRLVFAARAQFAGLEGGSGFSGFEMRGDVKLQDGGIVSRVTGFVVKHNTNDTHRTTS